MNKSTQKSRTIGRVMAVVLLWLLFGTIVSIGVAIIAANSRRTYTRPNEDERGGGSWSFPVPAGTRPPDVVQREHTAWGVTAHWARWDPQITNALVPELVRKPQSQPIARLHDGQAQMLNANTFGFPVRCLGHYQAVLGEPRTLSFPGELPRKVWTESVCQTTLELPLLGRVFVPYYVEWRGLLLNAVIYAAAAWGLSRSLTLVRSRWGRKPWQCPKCRYDRRGLPDAAVCPECGTTAAPI